MAHVNTSGVHIPIWLDSEAPQIGWGTSTSYPAQEGTFFGNIMETGDLRGINMTGISGPVAYFCEGQGITAGVVAGRLTSGAGNVPYKNPYGDKVACGNSGSVSGYWSAGNTRPADGFKSASVNGYTFQNGEPITVWRNPSYTPVFDAVYRYSFGPMHASGKVIQVAGGSTTNGTVVQQWTSIGVDSQKLAVISTGTNWKIAMKTNTNKCVGPAGNGTGNATRMEIQDCNGSNNQAWTITANANTGAFTVKNVAAGRCLDVTGNSTSDGAPMELWDCNGQANQLFKLSSSY